MPDESAEQSFNRAKEILQEAILRDYPNPERRGCPGAEILKRLASFDLPQTRDPAWDHVTHCSPCYSEFLIFRDERKKANSRARQRRRIVLAMAAALILVYGLWLFVPRFLEVRSSQEGNRQAPQVKATPMPAFLDFESVRIGRGEQDTQSRRLRYSLPVGDLDLKVRLPVGSEDGKYQIQILPEPSQAPVSSGDGLASLEDHSVLLKTRINLKGLNPGKYYIAFRRVDSEWTVLPLELE